MSAPPPVYFEVSNAVEDYLTKADQLQGWSIDAMEDPEDGKLQAFPFAKEGAVGAHVVYRNAKAGVTLQSDVSSETQSWRDLLPLLQYSKTVGQKAYSAEYNFRQNLLSQSYVDPTFFVTAKTGVTDGFASLVTATTRVLESVVVGCCANYDPKRSGLNNLTATAVRYRCPYIGGGDLLAKYSLRDGVGLHLRVPVHGYMDAAVIAEKNRFIAGVQGRSPCGARIMLNTNVNNGTVTATAIRNLNDIWKLSVTYTSGSLDGSGICKSSHFGLKLSNDCMLD